MEEIRINKYLAECGYCSRRAADKIIEAGRVTADGKRLKPGDRVTTDMDVRVDNKPVKPEDERIVIAFNKPVGLVCTADSSEKDNIVDAIGFPLRIYPVGRLDKDSRGLIFLTNDGDFANRMTHARYHHEKEYVVTVDREVTSDFIKQMSGGIYISELHRRTQKCRVKKIRYNTFSIVLTQGMNRQIRRMCETLGYRVSDLVRTRIVNVTLKTFDLADGEYHVLTDEEIDSLEKAMK